VNQPTTTAPSADGEVPAFTPPNVSDTLFHRVVVHGSTSPMQWLKLTVDPSANNTPDSTHFGPFSWERKNTGLGT
jgi:hypothetical protein